MDDVIITNVENLQINERVEYGKWINNLTVIKLNATIRPCASLHLSVLIEHEENTATRRYFFSPADINSDLSPS